MAPPRSWDRDGIDKGTSALIPTPRPGGTRAKSVYGKATGYTNLDALIPLADFIGYVQEVEKVYKADSPSDILTRLRVLYYDGTAFEQLIPGAHVYDYERDTYSYDRIPRIIYQGTISDRAYKHLTAQADENGLGDNPSPYLVLPSGERVDVGHLLLGVDALLHPTSGVPYTTYNVPTIDPASWVADVGIAAVWTTVHEESGKPHPDVVNPPAKADKDVYWAKSAPTEDILGDVDSFGLYDQWQAGKKSLSELLRLYYSGSTSTPKKRWQLFCAKNDLKVVPSTGSVVTWEPSVAANWIPRINKFNNLYADGKIGTLSAVVLPGVKPSTRNWPYTPYMMNKFLDWVKRELEKELQQSP
jgi:hypothetical protein